MRHSQRRRSGRVTPALSEELKVVLTGDLFCSSDPGSCRKRAKTQPQRSAMMPRKRARRGEAPQPEPQPGSALFDVEICESIEVTDSVRSCPAAALSSESDDLCGLELDRLFRLDELDWAFEREAGSPFLEEDGFPDLLDPAREAISAAGDAAPLLGSLADPREPGGGAEPGYGRGPSAQPCRDDSSGKSNKNAIAARLNRLRKKEYIRGLETKVSSMATENRDLREENRHLNKRVEELEDETRYLRAVLANESMLAQLLSRLTGVNGMKLSTSLFQEARRNEHDYALPRSGPRPGLRPGGRGAAGGVCLHVDNNHVSVEFCTKCADSASAALTM